MKKRRLKLKSEVYFIILFIISIIIFILSISSINEKLRKCDIEKNKTCSFYEIQAKVER